MTSDRPLIQLLRYGGLGDIIMMTGLFPPIRDAGYRIRIVTRDLGASLLQDHPLIDSLIALPPNQFGTVPVANEYISQLNEEPAAKSIMLSGPYPFITHMAIGPPVNPLHQHYLQFWYESLNFLGASTTQIPDELSLYLSPEMIEWGEQYKNTVLIHTQTDHSPYKNWPLSYWVELSQQIKYEFGFETLQLCKPDWHELPGISKLNAPSLRHAIAAIKACRVFVGLDSLFNHASRAIKKRSVILWGSTNPLAYGYAQNINLVNGIPWFPRMGNGPPLLRCQPCYREYSHIEKDISLACPYVVPHVVKELPEPAHPNPEYHQCMATNTVSTVYSYVKNILLNTL
jgi:hypothetical protein